MQLDFGIESALAQAGKRAMLGLAEQRRFRAGQDQWEARRQIGPRDRADRRLCELGPRDRTKVPLRSRSSLRHAVITRGAADFLASRAASLPFPSTRTPATVLTNR